jgi:Flp pilus assembly protein TadG
VPPTAATLAGPGHPVAPVRPADAGFLSLELLVVATVLILVALLAVGWGRLSYTLCTFGRAAPAAARAATDTSSPGAAAAAAQQTARADLAAAGISCATFTVSVDTSAFRPGGQVTVTVRCTARLGDVALAGFPGKTTMTGASTSPLEQLRDISLRFSNSDRYSSTDRCIGAPA